MRVRDGQWRLRGRNFVYLTDSGVNWWGANVPISDVGMNTLVADYHDYHLARSNGNLRKRGRERGSIMALGSH